MTPELHTHWLSSVLLSLNSISHSNFVISTGKLLASVINGTHHSTFVMYLKLKCTCSSMDREKQPLVTDELVEIHDFKENYPSF
jgi:hypothetical protein